MEELTNNVEAAAMEIIEKIDEMGGIVRAVEVGYPQREIADSAFHDQKKVESQERSIVGVNRYVDDASGTGIPLLKIHPEIEESQKNKLAEFKANRDDAAVARSIEAIRLACRGTDNLVVPILEGVKVGVTLGEVSDVFREEFGVYRDPAFV